MEDCWYHHCMQVSRKSRETIDSVKSWTDRNTMLLFWWRRLTNVPRSLPIFRLRRTGIWRLPFQARLIPKMRRPKIMSGTSGQRWKESSSRTDRNKRNLFFGHDLTFCDSDSTLVSTDLAGVPDPAKMVQERRWGWSAGRWWRENRTRGPSQAVGVSVWEKGQQEVAPARHVTNMKRLQNGTLRISNMN